LVRVAADWSAMVGAILYWGILGLLVTVVCGTLSYIMPSAAGERLGRQVHHHIFHFFVVYLRATGLLKIDLSELEKLGGVSSPIIVAPNHASLWDAVFIIARLPQAICVMKNSILRNPFLGGGSRLSGYIPNGAIPRMVRDAADALKRGGQLLLFPEGTRTHPTERWINPLKGGCALIAIRAKVPVYPVFIRTNSRFLQKGWPLWRPPVFPIRIAISVGEPLTPQVGESASEFTHRMQQVYEQELARSHPLRRQTGV
jgi:1-acyl-sn-glycerol-3-phosphate acyltransferase